MELIGTAKKILELQTFDSGFQKRSLILLTQEQYPQPINIEFLSDKVNLLNTIAEGDQIKVGINLRGREWTSPQGEVKYFNSIVGWRLEKLDATATEPSQPKPLEGGQSSASAETNVFDEEDEDDLPF